MKPPAAFVKGAAQPIGLWGAELISGNEKSPEQPQELSPHEVRAWSPRFKLSPILFCPQTVRRTAGTPLVYNDRVMLAKELKDAATAAFRDNARLDEMTSQDREQAAQGYEQLAQEMVGTQAGLARLYNLERAKFLRGQVSRIAARARDFADEIGFPSVPQPED